MDLIIEKPSTPPPGPPENLTLDHPIALAIGRIETFANPQGKPQHDIMHVRSRHDLIQSGIGFDLTLTNEFGEPERVRITYSDPNTQPEELLLNFEPERLPEIASNPDHPDRLSLVKRVFTKEAAIAALAEKARTWPLPTDLAARCREELQRMDNLLGMIRTLRKTLKGN